MDFIKRSSLKDIPKLWDKQNEAVRFAFDRLSRGLGVILAMGCGTGKTRCVEEVIQEITGYINDIASKDDLKLILVVSTIAGLYEWPKNWASWGRRPLAFIDLHDHRELGLRKAIQLAKGGGTLVCLINYSSLPLIGRTWIQKRRGTDATTGNPIFVKELVETDIVMDDVPWDFVILDEIHKLKTPGSQICKYVRNKLLWEGTKPKVKRRLGATGTLFTKRPLDAWGPVKATTGEEIFEGPVIEFKARFGIPDPNIRGRILAWTNLKIFAKLLHKCVIFLDKRDVVELPPEHDETFTVRLGQRALKLYHKIASEGYAEIVGKLDLLDIKIIEAIESGKMDEAQLLTTEFKKEITAAHIFSQICRLRQVSSGFVIPDKEPGVKTKPNAVRVDTAKVDTLMEFLETRIDNEIEETDPDAEPRYKPTVVVVQFDEEEGIVADACEKMFGERPKIINGSVHGAERRAQLIADAARDPVLIVKEEVAAEATDMRWTDYIMFYSHSYDTDIYEQMRSRNNRGGVKHKKVTFGHLIVDIDEMTSVDETIYKALNRDLKQAEKIKEYMKELRA